MGQKYEQTDGTPEIINAALEVHRTLGPGFVEAVYERALAHELQVRGISVQRQAHVPIYYKDELVGEHVLDLLVNGNVIVELKAAKEIADIHISIVVSYLTATQLPVGLIFNFAQRSLGIKRVSRFSD